MSFPPNPKRSPEQWQQLIEAQAASGQTQVAFCAEHGLSKSSFQLWKRRGRATSPIGNTPMPALFTPLTGATEPSRTATDWDVELDLGSGMCLRLRRPGL